MSAFLAFPGGPGYLSYDGHAVQMADAWTLTGEPTQFAITTNFQGVVDLREDDTVARLTATPLGLWGAAAVAGLYPYQPSMLGATIYPAADRPLVVQTAAGQAIAFARAALTRMPSLTFAGRRVLFGPAEWTMLRRTDVPATAAGAMYALAASPYAEPAFHPPLVLTAAATLNVGALTGVQTEEDGVTFTPTVTLTPRRTSQHGLCNYEIAGVGATVEFTPEGLTEGDLYGALHPLQGAGTGRGTSLAGIGGALTVTSVAGLALTIPLAAPTRSSLRFDVRTGRLGRVMMQALRANAAGVLRPLFTLAVAA